MTEQEIYEREARLEAARDEYRIKAKACKRAGGYMVFTKRYTRLGGPTLNDYRFARCQSGPVQ